VSHLQTDTLWSLSREELLGEELAGAKQHLAGCADCRVALEDVKLAQSVLMDLPSVPAMPEAMARRIGHELADAADKQAAKQFAPWWQSLFTPRFVLAAAMGLALAIAGAYVLASNEQPVNPVALPTPIPTPGQPLSPNAPTSTAKKLSVTVASAKKATASKKQVLQEGTTVSTQAGGSLWMHLPDGSRAGLTSASEVTLAKLEAKQLTLDVMKGSLALVVPHREDRVLVVRAGDLEVKDLGTRFLVSREPSHTVVAVEEGVVEVKTPTGTRQVKAGHAVTWRQGQLTELAWEPTPAVATAPVPEPVLPAVAADVPDAQVNSVARLEEEDDEGAPPPVEEQAQPTSLNGDQTPVAADEQWAGLPTKEKKLPPVSAFAPPPKTVVTSSERAFSLKNIERKLREIGATITTPSGREARAKNVTLAADAGDCEHALRLADAWLSEPVTGIASEMVMRRTVQLQQVRCLNKLGRVEDAAAIQRMVESAH
jgi:ferric-dicitrate binding protein FerR (iron transport regulator)